MSLLVVLVSASHKSRVKSHERRPPGPRGIPFVGSIHHLLTSQPQAALRDLADKYGPVMYLRLGQVDTVVVSSPAAAQVVLHDNDITFASRPKMLGTDIVCYGGLDMAMAPYGAYWRALRKLATLELLSQRKVRQFAHVRDSETLSLVRELRAAGGGCKPVNLGKMLMLCANSITGLATFGHRCSTECKEQFLSAMAMAVVDGSGLCVSDFFPSLWFIDVVTGTRRRLQRTHELLDRVTEKIIAECDARREERKLKNVEGEDKDEEDLLSVMLRIRDEGEFEIPIETTNIKAIIIDLFVAGTETTSAAAEWVMSLLLRNPEAMAKAQAEVRKAFNKKNTCDHESLLDHLHYTRLVIKETMRLFPPLPFLLPRFCRETCDVGGFKVAKGTRVIVNSWAMARSSKYWDDAEVFRPERFEKNTVDYKGTQFEYMPFGSGRRMCPGMAFGLVSLELIVARLLYYFNWSLPVGMRHEELDMDMTVGATARRTNHLQLMATPYAETVEI
ncbi:Cytochrome P450 99A2 [Dichanthelium oligosanthes]|uniref:Cytochrome P450 99A2 n=1 Tax=Dichanthelium oligosanthes TaxID=888268 RepID=A0A1E5V6J8_9POAL|nr:Cytochrome P450 99A2 [Dichanthelium oligosanthes]